MTAAVWRPGALGEKERRADPARRESSAGNDPAASFYRPYASDKSWLAIGRLRIRLPVAA